MTRTIENDLREALATRAAELGPEAAEGLRNHDYRPRVRSARPPAALGALATVGVAAAVAWTVGLGTGTPEAFAGWTPSPSAPRPGQIATATASCRQRLATVPSPPPGAGALPAGAVLAGPMSPELTDTRGPFTFVILVGAHGSASCITGPSLTALSGTASSGAQTVPAGHVSLRSSNMTAPSGHAYSFAEGRSGAGVTGATLVLDDGAHVTATLANGWFVAWWPGDHDVTSLQVATATGTNTQKIDILPARACPPGAACSSSSGRSGGGASLSIDSDH